MADADADVAWMGLALEQADAAAALGEVPVGCVLVADRDSTIVARGHNLRELTWDPTAHAEMVVLRAAAITTRGWRLDGTTLYVTLEPCAMCAGALVNARVSRVVYGCSDAKAGAVDTLYKLGTDPRLNHRFEVTSGVRADEARERLARFFGALRAQGKK